MALNKNEFSQFIRSFNFRDLFNEMGWNNDRTNQPIIVDDQTFSVQSVAEKSRFKVLVCSPTADGKIPDYNTRKKIESKVTKLFQEHLIIFADANKTEQIWQLVVRQTGKPTKVTETRWNTSQSPELLFQRAAGIFFEIDEEDTITIVDVTKRIAENFHQNAEKVTKQFYEKFKREHGSFYDFLTGMDDHLDEWNKTHPKEKKDNLNKQWYVSLMLNRLMFCYFIQKKGFLDNNKNYLRDKLKVSQEKKGKDKFYSFYRSFLLELFHSGLGSPNHDGLKAEIGKIPYLNGGLFDEHELESKFQNIQIDDKAFERIFDFFDDYEWHLDTRIEASGKDINPDVIGYIFEKYINDRAQMGAYYTKEDITEYISKNCVLPFLFDETERQLKVKNEKLKIAELIKDTGDRYIYDAVKHGVDEELPAEIAIGLDTTAPNLLERRKDWNKSAPSSHALPTEIWREVVERRKRYADVKEKIENGEIDNINDFITYNLNIRQFAQDVVENTNDAEFLKAFYQALNSVTIIDPTCGSGAFLFAAMNILEPLYEACLQRMRNFIGDEDRQNSEDKQIFAHKFKYFREVLEDVESPAHPNRQYFIYKSIILRNLYGVDIMKEAVEIAKLRLFLKLVATVDADYRKPNLGLEPLPDIDFNIRAGNTLIGFATESEIDKAFSGKFDFDNDLGKLKEKCEVVAMAFERYKQIQLSDGNDFADFKEAKTNLNQRLTELNAELSQLLHGQTSSLAYKDWHDSHQPFHWFAEFYEIIHDKDGFDVIIGNPPYVEYSKIRSTYTLDSASFKTLACGNLYAFVMERSFSLLGKLGKLGFIVPISLTCTQRMSPLQNTLLNNTISIWNSTYAERPDKLFSGAEVLLTISILAKGVAEETQVYSTGLRKWKSDEREVLFENTSYYSSSNRLRAYILPKKSSNLESSILNKIWHETEVLANDFRTNSPIKIFYRIGGGRYWKVFTNFQPKFVLNGKSSISSRESYLFFDNSETRDIAITVLSSTLFYWYFVLTTNGRDLNPSDLKLFPIVSKKINETRKNKLVNFCLQLLDDYRLNKQEKEKTSKQTGDIIYEEFYPRFSKPIIDEIDKVLAEHYGFTEEELDFIINYDIKYRMGKELEGESE